MVESAQVQRLKALETVRVKTPVPSAGFNCELAPLHLGRDPGSSDRGERPRHGMAAQADHKVERTPSFKF